MRLVYALAVFGFVGCAHQQSQTTTPAPNVASSTVKDVGKTQSGLGSDATDANAAAACGAVTVHFALDSSEIDDGAREGLMRTARCLRENQRLLVRIEGNADERGTEEYNLALGDRRAQSVVRCLRTMGASEPQVKTVSFGKANPLCTDHDEECWKQNRRAETKVTAGNNG